MVHSTRRQFLKNSAQLVLALGAPTLCGTLGCESSAGVGEKNLHEQLAEKVRGLKASNRTLTVFHPKGSLGNLKPTVRAFQKLTKVKIELVEASLDKISAEMILSNQIGRGNGRCDVALPATFGIPDLVEAGALEELTTLAEEHEPHDLLDHSVYTQGDRYKGKLYGYQTDGDVYVMFYNKTWMRDPKHQSLYFDTFGTKLSVPQTWSELDRQMQFFHAPEQNRFGGSLYRNLNYAAWEFWIRLHAKGVYPVDDGMNPRFDGPEGQEALGELIEATKYLEPAVKTQGLFDNFKSYSDGTKYCNIGWGGTQKYLSSPNSKLRGQLAYGLVPGGEIDGQRVSMPYFNWGWNFVVSSGSTLKELAYLFILFASTPNISTQSILDASGYFDPFRTEHYRDPGIQALYGQEFLDVHYESLSTCIPDFYMRGQGRYLSALKRAVHTALLGHVTQQKALEAVVTKWNTITDTMGREAQCAQWKFLKRSYPEKLKRLLS